MSVNNNLGSDVTTVVSICPIRVYEVKPGITPGVFQMDPGSPEDPQFLFVGPGEFSVYLGEERYFPATTPSIVMAKSIVDDFCASQLSYASGCRPGLFYIPGTVSSLKPYGELVQQAIEFQVNWFRKLVMLADTDWNKHKSHKMISEVQRAAAKYLGVSDADHEWLRITSSLQTKSHCPACRTQVDPLAVVCSICKAILDTEAFKKFTFVKE